MQLQENTPTNSRMEEQTEGSSKYNCSRLAFKVKDIKYDAGLTRNYCLKVSMQKISSTHKLIL